MDRADWDKMFDYAHIAERKWGAEISGIAIMSKTEDGRYHIRNPRILKQTVTSGTTTLDKDALADYYSEQAELFKKEGKNPTDLHFVWWHSHANMGVFWSSTDDRAINEFGGGKWSLSIVVNVKGEYKARVQFFDPIEHELDVAINFPEHIRDIPEALRAEVSELVSPPTSQYQRPSESHYRSPGSSYNKICYKEHVWTKIGPGKAGEPSKKSGGKNTTSPMGEVILLSALLGSRFGDELVLGPRITRNNKVQEILDTFSEKAGKLLYEFYQDSDWKSFLSSITELHKRSRIDFSMPEWVGDQAKTEEFISRVTTTIGAET